MPVPVFFPFSALTGQDKKKRQVIAEFTFIFRLKMFSRPVPMFCMQSSTICVAFGMLDIPDSAIFGMLNVLGAAIFMIFGMLNVLGAAIFMIFGMLNVLGAAAFGMLNVVGAPIFGMLNILGSAVFGMLDIFYASPWAR